MTLRAKIHRAAPPTHGGLVAEAIAPAYSSESTIALLGRDRVPASRSTARMAVATPPKAADV
jgi:hypothetical protein